MMRYSSIIVFVILVTSSALASIGSYRAAQDMIVDDLNRALIKTVTESHGKWLTTDTVKAYRQLQSVSGENVALNYTDDTLCRHLSIPQLRNMAYMRLRILNGENTDGMESAGSSSELCSDTVVWQAGHIGTGIALRSYAHCSVATVFNMSDQRLPLALGIAALIWALMTMWPSCFNVTKRDMTTGGRTPAIIAATDGHGMTHCDGIALGGIVMTHDGNSFRNTDNTPIRFTPMQHTLMQMFFCSEDHRLTKTDICEALWPKKEDPSETLYTLIRRLKTVVESNSNLRIESDRGRAYLLRVKQME